MFDSRYWLWLSLIFEPGSGLCDSLLFAFGDDPKSIYDADEPALARLCGDNIRLKSALLDKRLDRTFAIMEFCQKENVGILTPDSKLYPSALLRINGRPPVLYYKGKLPDFSGNLCVGVVGTRSVTPYGSSAAYTISHDLASAGAVVVSGMALGSDTAAHRGALDASGHTVAFLGCGIDVVYPKDNAKLMQEIISTGTVMTDYPPGSRPEGRHFPVRNRLISGVSSGVLVVEASEKSGALITAEHARRQGKLVYAVPGKVGELESLGTNRLIANGAKMATGAADILCDFTELFPNIRIPAYNKTADLRTSGGYAPQNTRKTVRSESNLDIIGSTDSKPESFPVTAQNNTRPQPSPQIRKNPYEIPRPAKPFSAETMEEMRAAMNKQESEIRFVPAQPNNTVLKAAQPRPVIIYSDDDEAKSYMSMDDNPSSAPRLPETPYSNAAYLIYPKGPIPAGGYEIDITPDGQKRYEEINESGFRRRFPQTGIFSPVPGIEIKDDPVKDASSANKKTQKNSGAPDTNGLSENEKTVIEYLYKNGRSTADGMCSTGLPVSKLLAALTVLEIKHRVTQLPGGYFEII